MTGVAKLFHYIITHPTYCFRYYSKCADHYIKMILLQNIFTAPMKVMFALTERKRNCYWTSPHHPTEGALSDWIPQIIDFLFWLDLCLYLPPMRWADFHSKLSILSDVTPSSISICRCVLHILFIAKLSKPKFSACLLYCSLLWYTWSWQIG